MSGDPDRTRRLSLAEWHVRESYLLDAAGDFDGAEGHLEDAREFLALAKGAPAIGHSADDLTAEIEIQRDMQQ